MAAEQDTGLASSFSGNNIPNIIDIDLLKAKLVDALVLYHVGKCRL
jgi:hypothetical protein